MDALNELTMSMISFITEGSSAAMMRRPVWKLPVLGFSLHFTFWIRYGYISIRRAALGHDMRWILMPSVLVTNPNTSSPNTGLQHLAIL